MDWIKRMERILDYIEENLCDTIDFNEIAKLACCSNYNFNLLYPKEDYDILVDTYKNTADE